MCPTARKKYLAKERKRLNLPQRRCMVSHDPPLSEPTTRTFPGEPMFQMGHRGRIIATILPTTNERKRNISQVQFGESMN